MIEGDPTKGVLFSGFYVLRRTVTESREVGYARPRRDAWRVARAAWLLAARYESRVSSLKPVARETEPLYWENVASRKLMASWVGYL